MIIDRFGIRPAPSKIEAITQLSQPSMVEEVRILLGMTSKKARRLKVPWSQAQTEAVETLVSPLTSPPILALPDLNKYFRLHTDASKTGAGAVLTQIQEMVEKP